MDVRITTRHVDLRPSFMAHAGERTSKLTKYEPRLIGVDLLFEDDHGKLTTEARATVPGRPLAVARGSATDPRASLDEALRKLSRQLRRGRKKRVDHQAPPPAVVIED